MQDKVVFFNFCFLDFLQFAFIWSQLSVQCMCNHLFFVVYKMVNAAYIVLPGQMSDALLIVIYCSVYICSGWMTGVSEACLMMISSFLLVCITWDIPGRDVSGKPAFCSHSLHWDYSAGLFVFLFIPVSLSLTLSSWCKWLLLPPRAR